MEISGNKKHLVLFRNVSLKYQADVIDGIQIN